MTTWTRALVTGASSGIGGAIARQLASDGTALVVVARDSDRLHRLAETVDVECEVLVADLTDRSDLCAVEERFGVSASPIDLLVNNAGVGFQGRFFELDADRAAEVVDVNVTALHRLALAAAPPMVRVGRGGILNVSSVAGFTSTPRSATYSATKAFVTSLSESLHSELEPFGVHVSALCPGFTRTEFQARADYDASSVPDAAWQTAEDVAVAGLEGIARNRTIVVPGMINRVAVGGLNAFPAALRRRLVRRLAD